jgi:hypothetical protein
MNATGCSNILLLITRNAQIHCYTVCGQHEKFFNVKARGAWALDGLLVPKLCMYVRGGPQNRHPRRDLLHLQLTPY